MVAYSFAPQFRHQVAALSKRQTVRAYRKRHARPGEPGMSADRLGDGRGPLRVLQVCARFPPDMGGIETHVHEVARRIRRLGISEVDVAPGVLGVTFWDQRVKARVALTIEPWFHGKRGWFWHEFIGLTNGFVSGPMGQGRYILDSPHPSQVVRAYQDEIRWERRSPPRKNGR